MTHLPGLQAETLQLQLQLMTLPVSAVHGAVRCLKYLAGCFQTSLVSHVVAALH